MEIKLTIEATGLERAMTLLAEAIGYHTVTKEKKQHECKCLDKAQHESKCQGVNESVTPARDQEPTFIQNIPADEAVVPNAPLATQPVLSGLVPPAVPAVAPITAPVVPTTAPTYSLDQLAVAATQLMDAGNQPALLGLLGQFQVNALTALPKEQYGPFATALRQLGARI